MNLMPKRNRLALIAAPLLLALGACATPFNANVSRFQAELPAPAGQTFAIVPQDPRNAGGLEFAQYAGIVAAQLQKVGYVPAASAQAADLVVQFDYGVDRGRDRLRDNGFADPFWGAGWGPGWGGRWGGRWAGGWGPGWGGWGPGFGGGWGGWGPGWGGGFGGGVDVVTVFTSGIDMKIDRRADGKRLFEGKAEASSNSNRLPYLVPKLVEAMFTNFPGSNGETVRISVAPEKKKS